MYLVIGEGRIEDMTNGCSISGVVHATLDQARALSVSIGDGASVYGLEFKGQAVEIHRTDWHTARDCPRKRFGDAEAEHAQIIIRRQEPEEVFDVEEHVLSISDVDMEEF